MNVWQSCPDTKDAVPLYPAHGLYLKPTALLHISVRLPLLKVPGSAVSNWEIMEKLKYWIQPEEFLSLKISKSTLEFIRYDGEIMNKSKLNDVLAKLDGKSIKLCGIKEQLKVRAVVAKSEFPSKHDWDSFFRDAKDMNEMKAGERPDTVYFGNLPCKWFSLEKDDKPSEKLLRKIFEQFGEVRRIDVPMLDSYRNQMNCNISGIKQFTFNKNVIFECYIQFMEYFCFVKCMDTFRGMKLVFVDEKKNAFISSIKVDFDKSKHMSDAFIQRRKIIRDRLERKEAERLAVELKKKEEEENIEKDKKLQKLERRKLREQKRKEKQIEKLKLKEVEEMNKKIASEEYLLLMAQRKLESIRLLGELINRIKAEKEKELISANRKKRKRKLTDGILAETAFKDVKDDVSKELDTEKDLRYRLIQKFKKMQQKELLKEKERLKALTTDESALTRKRNDNSPAKTLSSDSDCEVDAGSSFENNKDVPYGSDYSRHQNRQYWHNNRERGDRPFFHKSNGYNNDYPSVRGRYNRGRRGFGRPMYQNSWRGQYSNQCMVPLVDPLLLTYSHEYYKYIQKIARDSKRSKYSSSRSRSRTRSRSYSRSYSRSRSRSRARRSYSRSHSRSYTRSRSRSRTKSKTRTKSRTWSRSRSRTKSEETRKNERSEKNAKGSKENSTEPNEIIQKKDNVPSDNRTSKKTKKKKKKKRESKDKGD